MLKQIHLKITRIKYSGDSIGNDIRIAGKVFGTSFALDQRIKREETIPLDFVIGSTATEQSPFTFPLSLQVVERDPLFNDVGGVTKDVTVDLYQAEIQSVIFRIEVRESRGARRRQKAVFEITCETHIAEATGEKFRHRSIAWWKQWRALRPYTYTGSNRKENYNRYDAIIKRVIARWNKQFYDDTFPPIEPLDPNLVKAMIFQESRMGYDRRAGINVMQVGKTGDPSLRTLRGELKEYWLHKGKLQPLRYDARVRTVEDSIHWGTRWLYHKAQENKPENTRTWKSWHDAVKRYGPGTERYVQSVWGIYREGIKKEKNQTITLWSFNIFALLFGVAMFLQPLHQSISKGIVETMSVEGQVSVSDTELTYWRDQSLFFAIIAREKDWWEDIRVGRKRGDKIQWLKMDEAPDEASIFKARFLTVRGFLNPLLEVYGATHMGNGAFYLYEVGAREVKLLRTVPATVDSYFDSAARPGNYERYGYFHCGEIIRGGALESRYVDLNYDGVDDFILHGVVDVFCEKDGSQRIRVDGFERENRFVLSGAYVPKEE